MWKHRDAIVLEFVDYSPSYIFSLCEELWTDAGAVESTWHPQLETTRSAPSYTRTHVHVEPLTVLTAAIGAEATPADGRCVFVSVCGCHCCCLSLFSALSKPSGQDFLIIRRVSVLCSILSAQLLHDRPFSSSLFLNIPILHSLSALPWTPRVTSGWQELSASSSGRR